MTHDELTTRLRDPRPTMSIDAQTTMLDAADRLDRYRELLRAARRTLTAEWDDWADEERDVIADIDEALK